MPSVHRRRQRVLRRQRGGQRQRGAGQRGGQPVAGMALILGVDRFMSECRSLTNFIGNAVATVVVARWEGALDRDALGRALDGPSDSIASPPDPSAGPGDPARLASD